MKRLIAAALFSAVAGAAFAQQAVEPVGRYVIVEEGQVPPPHYVPHVPSYEWKDGRFVRNGQLYQSLHGAN